MFFSTCSWHGLEHKHTRPEEPPLWCERKSKGRGSWQGWPHLQVKNYTNQHHTRQTPVSTLQCYSRHTGTFHRGREALRTPRWIDLTLLTSDKGSWKICAEQNLHSFPFQEFLILNVYVLPVCDVQSEWVRLVTPNKTHATHTNTNNNLTIGCSRTAPLSQGQQQNLQRVHSKFRYRGVFLKSTTST